MTQFKLKPLNWVKQPSRERNLKEHNQWFADTGFGRYYVETYKKDNGEIFTGYGKYGAILGHLSGPGEHIEEAKEAVETAIIDKIKRMIEMF